MCWFAPPPPPPPSVPLMLTPLTCEEVVGSGYSLIEPSLFRVLRILSVMLPGLLRVLAAFYYRLAGVLSVCISLDALYP